MTVLTCDPADTGEIPRSRPMPAPTTPTVVPDGATTRLVPPPRRPAADDTGEILYRADRDAPETVGDLDARGCRTIVPNDEDFTTAPAAPPRPLPTPPPAPKPADDQGAAQIVGPLERVADLYAPPLQAYRPVEQEYMGKHRPRPGLIARVLARLGLKRGAR